MTSRRFGVCASSSQLERKDWLSGRLASSRVGKRYILLKTILECCNYFGGVSFQKCTFFEKYFYWCSNSNRNAKITSRNHKKSKKLPGEPHHTSAELVDLPQQLRGLGVTTPFRTRSGNHQVECVFLLVPLQKMLIFFRKPTKIQTVCFILVPMTSFFGCLGIWKKLTYLK